MSATETKLRVVALNGDIVDYSRHMADDLDGTSRTVADYRSLIERSVEDAGGRLVNFVGDNFMAVFDDAVAAMETAIRVTGEIEVRNSEVPAARRMRFRMGLDRGEVAVTADDYHGDALNIAARIQALAPAGGIAVSGAVYRSLDRPALRFRPTGPRVLKNIPGTVEVYEFADLPTDNDAPRGSGPLSLDVPTVAVLPAHAEGVDDRVHRAMQLIRGELVHRLARIPDLRVIDAGAEPGDPAHAGVARYMLETGVHQFDDDVRIFVTLFDVTTVNVVKSHKWMVDAAGLVALSDQIADEVGRAIEVELVIGQPAGLYAELDDAESIEKVYLGWYHLRNDTPAGWRRALELFSDVARAHPDQPYGPVLLAFAYWLGAANEWAADVGEALGNAREQARLAEDIGDLTGMATAVRAAVMMSEGNMDGALAAMDELEIVRPTCDVTFGLEGSVRRYLGQWEKAVDLLDVAMRLTGIDKPWYPTVKACSLFVGGRIQEAADLAESVLEYQPRNLEALLVLAAAQSELGLERRAAATARLIRERFPGVDAGDFLDRSPYADAELIDRWKADLSRSGVM